jgi:hypothetical protein
MSQFFVRDNSSSGADIETITGNSGGAVGPDGSFNINLLGSTEGGINIVGNPGSHTLTVSMQSPFSGDFTFDSGDLAAQTETLTISNLDTGSALASSQLLVKVAGAGGGDPYTTYNVTGASDWSIGVDNSASDAFVIAASAALGTTNAVSISTAGTTTFPLGNVNLSRSQVGGGVSIAMTNLDNTNPASDCAIVMNTGGSSAGDTFITFANTSVTAWTAGLDNSASDAFVIAASSALGTSNAVSINASTQDVTVVNNLYAKRPIVTQSDSNTFALTDANTWQKCTKGTAMTLTVPANATIAFPIGTEIDVYQQGAGQVTIAAAGGVTINSAFGNLKIAAQYTGASLKKTDTDVWELVGNLTA